MWKSDTIVKKVLNLWTYYFLFLHFIQGIVKALQNYQKKLLEHKVAIFVRRGGPNYQEGLRIMREVGRSSKLLRSYRIPR